MVFESTKARIIVVFADIQGSSRWTRRMADEDKIRNDFWMAYDRESIRYKEATGTNFHKRLGDGRMFVHELDESNASETASTVLNAALVMTAKVTGLIQRLPSPRPRGFRIRIMSGMVQFEQYPDGERDWMGYVPNSCHKFLSVFPDHPCIVQESFKDLIRPEDVERHGFIFALAQGERRQPEGVDYEDVHALWDVTKRHPILTVTPA